MPKRGTAGVGSSTPPYLTPGQHEGYSSTRGQPQEKVTVSLRVAAANVDFPLPSPLT